MNNFNINKKVNTKGLKKDEAACRTGRYDVVIIGAGIGGLTCGCYSAQNIYRGRENA